MSTRETGNFGERLAENFLSGKGYRILDRNFVFRIPGSPQKGETDMVARKGDLIVFIEVKAIIKSDRGRASIISPEERVNFAKQRKLRLAAESWLMKNKIPLNSKWQIDIVSVEISGGKAKISHFENAVGYC